MSGGSWDYVFSKFEDVAGSLQADGRAERRALGRLVLKVAKAMHDIEWVDSGDYGAGDERKAIADAVGGHKALAVAELQELVREGQRVAGDIDSAIRRASTVSGDAS